MGNARHIYIKHTNTLHILMCSSSSGNSSYTCTSLICFLLSLLSLLFLSFFTEFSTTPYYNCPPSTIHHPTGGTFYVCGKVSLQAGDKGSNSMQLHMDTCSPPSSCSIVKSSEGTINNLREMFLVA